MKRNIDKTKLPLHENEEAAHPSQKNIWEKQNIYTLQPHESASHSTQTFQPYAYFFSGISSNSSQGSSDLLSGQSIQVSPF
jgi:hypothetical protein